MARPLPAPNCPGTCALKPNRRAAKRLSSSRSSVCVETMPAMNSRPVDCVDYSVSCRNAPAECSVPLSPADYSRTSKARSSRMLVTPSAGVKLGLMLNLIKQENVEFMQHPLFTQIELSSKEGKSRARHVQSVRRLRSLIALAHHLEEEDRFLEVHQPSPSHSIPLSPAESLESVGSADSPDLKDVPEVCYDVHSPL